MSCPVFFFYIISLTRNDHVSLSANMWCASWVTSWFSAVLCWWCTALSRIQLQHLPATIAALCSLSFFIGRFITIRISCYLSQCLVWCCHSSTREDQDYCWMYGCLKHNHHGGRSTLGLWVVLQRTRCFYLIMSVWAWHPAKMDTRSEIWHMGVFWRHWQTSYLGMKTLCSCHYRMKLAAVDLSLTFSIPQSLKFLRSIFECIFSSAEMTFSCLCVSME